METNAETDAARTEREKTEREYEERFARLRNRWGITETPKKKKSAAAEAVRLGFCLERYKDSPNHRKQIRLAYPDFALLADEEEI